MAGVLEDEDFDLTQAEAVALEQTMQEIELKARLRQGQDVVSTSQQDERHRSNSSEDGQPLQQDVQLSDIEDAGKVFDRRAEYRRQAFFVTDFSASEWCQQQTAFKLTTQLPQELVTTPAMQAGIEKHAALHQESLPPGEVIELVIDTREDAFAARLLAMETGIAQLVTEGMTREFPILGQIQLNTRVLEPGVISARDSASLQTYELMTCNAFALATMASVVEEREFKIEAAHKAGQWVQGIVDQLDLTPEEGQVRIVEQKTRFQPSSAGKDQKRTTALQVMLYRQLMEKLPSLFNKASLNATFSSRGLDPCRDLNSAIQLATLEGGGIVQNLQQLCTRFHQTAQALPACSDQMLVNYLWQGDGLLLEQDSINFDQGFLDSSVAKHLAFWVGDSAPAKVPDLEQWKCRCCNFRKKCWPDSVRQVPWQH